MARVISGAKLGLFVSNVPVAYANNVQFTSNLKYEEIREIDGLEVVEFAELGTEVTFTAQQFRINFNSAKAKGWEPSLNSLLKQPELTATVFNKFDGATVMTLQGLKLVGRQGSVDARGVYTETLTFRARAFYDEAGL